MSKQALRVKINAEIAEWLIVDHQLVNCRLGIQDGGTRLVAKLMVESINHHDDDVPLAKLVAQCDASRAALWLFMEELRLGHAVENTASRTLVKMPSRIPARGVYNEAARLERLQFMREFSGTPLSHLQKIDLRAERLTGNIENLLGSVEIPVGLVGPLYLRGEKARGTFFAPFATTEGALVASATRGATAMTDSGGASSRVIGQRMMRVPLFVLSDIKGGFLFKDWIADHIDEIREQTRKVSRYAQLIDLVPQLLGNTVHVKFLYETGDAAGQNMTTTCTWHACQWIMQQVKHIPEISLEHFLIDANMSGDKKVTYQSFIEGRGTRVVAECFLTREVLQRVLKVTPGQLVDTHRVALAGSIHSGMIGYNINVANVVAAMFAALGQDIACVHESSLAQLNIQDSEDGIYASLVMPSLIVGTVGGGTHLPRQQELLAMMDCAGPGKSAKLAEIIAGFCLALDLSTLSAVASGQFASAHEKLGRNRPVNWFTKADLKPDFFASQLHVKNIEPLKDVTMGSSIITELTSRKVNKLVGFFPYRLNCDQGLLDVMIKVKPTDDEVILVATTMAAMCGGILAPLYAKFKQQTGFAGCHIRELGIYEQQDERFTKHVPKVYGIHRDDTREAYVVVLERLVGMQLMDRADESGIWNREHIETALRGLAQLHAIWYKREDALNMQPWLGIAPSAKSMTDMSELWEALGVHAREEFPEWVSEADLALHRKLVKQIPDWWGELEKMPMTLIHNDFNPRNICLRPVNNGLRLCAYDWELATKHLPQHDVAELLSFVLLPTTTKEEVRHYLDFYRHQLSQVTGYDIDAIDFREGFRYCLTDLVINRMATYMMAHTFRHYGFMERVFKTLRQMIRLEIGV